ncbi:YesL family protein [Fundicoccus sp. Sow4_H7]|uniref:YesL family protein n=1 Tax=Fundicoccus sp. Sow4_H7 TaxID=3438784 RepID=UPI003F8F6320
MTNNKFVNGIYKLGLFMLELFKLQVWGIVYSFKSFLVLGVFPAISAIFASIMYNLRTEDEDLTSIYNAEQFKQYYSENFKQSNILGYLSLAVILFLYVDLRVSQHFIGNSYLHFFLIVMFVIALSVICYIFPSIVSFDLRTKDHIKQAFYLALCSIKETIAAVLGIGVAIFIMTLFPFLHLLLFVPMYIFPIAWFGDIAIKNLLKRNEVNETNNKGSVY